MSEERVVVNRASGDTVRTTDGRPVVGRSVSEERVTRSPSGAEVARRIVVFVFGVVQLVIGLRIILLAIDADRANSIVAGLYTLSAPLVTPFEGILRTDAVHANGSMLDIAAIVALVGWTILEYVFLRAVAIGRREP